MAHIITRNSKEHYIAGLYWFAPKTGTKPRDIKNALDAKHIVAQRALKGEPNLGVALKGNSLPFTIGLAHVADGVATSNERKFTYPLGYLALAGNAVKGSFIGRLALDEEKHWFLTVRSGVIMPLGDRVVNASNSEESFQQLKEDNPDLVIAFDVDDHTCVDETIASWRKTQKSTGEKLRNVTKVTNLYTVSAQKKRAVAMWLVVLVVGSMGAGAAKLVLDYKTLKDEQTRIEQMRQQEMLARNQPIPRPWEAAVAMPNLVFVCNERYNTRQKIIQGWEMEAWECNKNHVLETWRRTEDGVFSIMPAGAVFDSARPNIATITLPIDSLPLAGPSAIAHKEEAAKYLMDLGMLGRANVEITWGTEATRPIPVNGVMIYEPLGYAMNTVALSLNERPTGKLLEQLARVPSLYIDSIKKSGPSWKLVANFYSTLEA